MFTNDPTRPPFFVYGTLRPGCGNTWAWEGLAEPVADGTTIKIGHRLTTHGGFPWAIESPMCQTVGTLIVPHDAESYDTVLDNMDRLEGEGFMYRRIRTAVLVDGVPVKCWMYEAIGDRPRLLPDVATNDAGRFDWIAQRHAREVVS